MTSNSGRNATTTDEFDTVGQMGMASWLRRPDVDPELERKQHKTFLYHGT